MVGLSICKNPNLFPLLIGSATLLLWFRKLLFAYRVEHNLEDVSLEIADYGNLY